MAFSVPPYCLDIPCKTSSGKRGVESTSGGRREYRNTGGIKLSDKKMESRAVRSYSLCKKSVVKQAYKWALESRQHWGEIIVGMSIRI